MGLIQQQEFQPEKVLSVVRTKTISKIFTYGIIKKEILTTKSDLGVDIKIKIK